MMRKASRYGSFTRHRRHSAETKFFSFLHLSSTHVTVFKTKQEFRHGESEHLLMILSCLQKLVNETFQKLWFTPTPAHDKETMTRKILNITDVVSLSGLTLFCSVVNSQFTLNSSCLGSTVKVAACRDTGYDWFEQLLQNVST